jgi:hypothetical protein
LFASANGKALGNCERISLERRHKLSRSTELSSAARARENESWKEIFKENDKLCRSHQDAFKRSGGGALQILYLDTPAVEVSGIPIPFVFVFCLGL